VESHWSPEEYSLIKTLASPEAIQEFLDSIKYNVEITCRSPRRVIRDCKANCMEGALFAAAMMHHLGQHPILVNLKAVRDDDHVIAIFKKGDRFGAIAKSNFTGLRYRSPVYRTLRELALSYFDHHFNTKRELTLRAYSRSLNLRTKRFGLWQIREDDLDDIAAHLDQLPHTTIVTAEEEVGLRLVDARLYTAGLLGADERGLYNKFS
jgi:hypothetical protein